MREYRMEEMKRVIGHNIVALRRGAGLTQSELAERLNYSDKAVSKWECGDAVPDVLVLTRLTEMFGVTLDWLVKSEHEVNMPTPKKLTLARQGVIMFLSVAFVWVIATAVFVLLGGFTPGGHGAWLSFIVAIPVSGAVATVFAAVWKFHVVKYVMMTPLLWGTILSAFLALVVFNATFFEPAWLLFILGIPFQIFILLWAFLSPVLMSKIKPYVPRRAKKQDAEK